MLVETLDYDGIHRSRPRCLYPPSGQPWRLTASWTPCAWIATVYGGLTGGLAGRHLNTPVRSLPLRYGCGSRSCRVIVCGRTFR
jgi:hypothetical protein